MQPDAKMITHSVSPDGVQLMTFEVTLHRIVQAELNTHRWFSRNSASSRAIPVEKLIKRIEETPAMPLYWGKNQSGMQAREQLTGESLARAQHLWLLARNQALQSAYLLSEWCGLHKQTANRLLEPWMFTTVIITTTDVDNFFWQRCHPDAQPEMKAAADAMQLAYYTSTPQVLQVGQWHLPYITDDDWKDAYNEVESLPGARLMQQEQKRSHATEIVRGVSVARCARVSFLNHAGQRLLSADLKLFEFLKLQGHWSPFEHVATPCHHVAAIRQFNSAIGEGDVVAICKRTGNFRHGWHQYRKDFPNENRTRFIPNLPQLAELAERMMAA